MKVSAVVFSDANNNGAFDTGETNVLATVTGNTYAGDLALAAGASYNIRAVQTDGLGQSSPVGAALSVTVDTVVPATPVAPDLMAASDSGLLGDDNTTRETLPVFKVLLPATGLEVGALAQLFNGATKIGEQTLSQTDLTNGFALVTVSTALSANGTTSVTAKVVDLAGNASVASPALNVLVDNTAPAAPVTPDLAAADDQGYSNTDNISNQTSALTFTATVEANSKVEFFKDVNNNGLIDAGESLGVGTVVGTVGTLDNVSLSEGVYAIKAVQTDAAGNTSLATATALNLKVDTTRTQVTSITSTTADGSYNAGKVIAVTVNFDEPVYFGGTSPTLNITLNSGKVLTFAGAANTAYGTITVNYTVAAGDNAADLAVTNLSMTGTSPTLRDAAGNDVDLTSLAQAVNLSASKDIRIDTLAPVAPGVPDVVNASDTGLSNTDNITGDRRPVFRISLAATVEEGDTAQLYYSTSLGTSKVLTATDIANGYVELSWPADLGIANYGAFNAKLVDKAGNVSVASADAPALLVDLSAPAAPLYVDLATADDTGYSSTDSITKQSGGLTLTASVETGAKVEFFNDINNDGLIGAGESLGLATVVGSTATLDNLDLAEGVYKIKAIQTDVAGNVSAVSTALDAVVDFTPAQISSMASTTADGAYNLNKIITIVVNFTEAVYFGGTSPMLNLTLNNGKTLALAVSANVAYNSLTFSYTVAAADAGVMDLSVTNLTLSGNGATLQDAAGNGVDLSKLPLDHNLGDTSNIRIDTTAPGAPGAPDLLDENDTGISSTDNITRNQLPVVRVSLTGTNAEVGDTAEIYYNGTKYNSWC